MKSDRQIDALDPTYAQTLSFIDKVKGRLSEKDYEDFLDTFKKFKDGQATCFETCQGFLELLPLGKQDELWKEFMDRFVPSDYRAFDKPGPDDTALSFVENVRGRLTKKGYERFLKTLKKFGDSVGTLDKFSHDVRDIFRAESQEDLCVDRPTFKGNVRGNLPVEIWFMIVDQYVKSCTPEYKAIQPISISSSSGTQILHCRGVTLDMENFENKTDVTRAEEWLKNPEAFKKSKYNTINYTSTLYDILFVDASTPALRRAKCLFSDVTVPDVIAFLQDGNCWVCDDRRELCPGCTDWVPEELDARMCCGVDLACPLCMGLEFMANDKDFRRQYYWDPAPSEEQAARAKRIRHRLAELDYLDDWTPSGNDEGLSLKRRSEVGP
ncbi:MAG: hypothetical protein Q9218_007519 [Villophora microphyllina]